MVDTTLYFASLISPSNILYNFVQTCSHLAAIVAIIIFSIQRNGFILTKMSSQSNTMFLLHEILPRRISRNAQLTSFEQHTILDYEIKPLCHVKCNWFCRIFQSFTKIKILILEFLEPNHFNLHLC